MLGGVANHGMQCQGNVVLYLPSTKIEVSISKYLYEANGQFHVVKHFTIYINKEHCTFTLPPPVGGLKGIMFEVLCSFCIGIVKVFVWVL